MGRITMKYYVDDDNNIFAYEDDGSQDEYIGGKKQITKEEAHAILNPPLTHEQEVLAAELTRDELILSAKSTISLWQTELQLGIISNDDKASLIQWIDYIKDVQSVDTSTAPDIDWPVEPAK